MRHLYFALSVSLFMSVGALCSEDIPLGSLPHAQSKTLLPKSLALYEARLASDTGFFEYLEKMGQYLKGDNITFDPDDACASYITKTIAEQEIGHDWFTIWVGDTLEICKEEIDWDKFIIFMIKDVDSEEELCEYFSYLASTRESALRRRAKDYRGMDRPQTLPCTLPDIRKTYTPIDNSAAQRAIDRHAIMSETLKETYNALRKINPALADEHLATVVSNSVLGKYLQRQLDEIPDPDTCLALERDVYFDPLPTGNAKRDKLRKKQAQKKAARVAVVLSEDDVLNDRIKAPLNRPNANRLALIKEGIAQKRKTIEARQKEKERLAQNASRIRALIQETAKPNQTSTTSTHQMQPLMLDLMTSDTVSAKQPTLPVLLDKEKTKGVADLSRKKKKKAKKKKRGLSSHDALMPQPVASQKQAEVVFPTALRKQLVDFWDAKVGLTYSGVTNLFKGLGGEVKEKSGGSSHVTLKYHLQCGRTIKHELWRPHAGINTFGFKTIAGLKEYFEECGLVVPKA